jgi:hypothetical protein
MEVVDEYKYLGADVGKTGQGMWNTLLNRTIEDAQKRSNLIAWTVGGKAGLRPRTALHLWNTRSAP